MNHFTQNNPRKTKIILILFGLLISLAIGETMVRAFIYYQYVNSSNRVQYEQYKKIFSDERDKDYVFGHKKNINVKFEKGNLKRNFDKEV